MIPHGMPGVNYEYTREFALAGKKRKVRFIFRDGRCKKIFMDNECFNFGVNGDALNAAV